MATVLEKAKLERKTARRLFSMAAERLEESLASKDRTDLKARFKNLSEKYSTLSATSNRVQSLWLDVPDFDEAAFEADLENSEKYCERWFILQHLYEEACNIDPDPNSPEGTVVSKKRNAVSECEFKATERLYLPKIELPRFDGNIKGWIAFWGLFNKIHVDKSIQDDLKFQYLLQCMEPGSPARDFMESFPPSGANYATAIDQLKARYGRDDLLIEVYVRELLSLVLDQSKGSTTPIGTLYDKLKTQLHCLESLGVTSDKYAAMLRPLVESAMPIDLLRVWERSSAGKRTLKDLLDFLKQEVESEERIKISHKISYSENFSAPSTSTTACFTTAVNKKEITKQEKSCLWCEKTSHTSSECSVAIKKSLEERRDFIKKKNACSICLNIGHFWKRCRKYPKCVFCGKRHYPIMCPQTSNSNTNYAEHDPSKNISFQNSTHNNDSGEAQKAVLSQMMPAASTVLLQTLKLNIVQGNQTITVRALLDSGAQHSFVINDVVERLKLIPCGQASLSHSLFGGVVTKKESYKSYVLNLRSLDGTFEHRMTALSQGTICNYLPKLRDAQLIADLKKHGVHLNDTTDDINEISVLIGSDFMGLILTGGMVTVKNSLVAIETKFGWTIQGPAPGVYGVTENITSLFLSFDVEDLWKLETIGIRDEAEVKKQKIIDSEVEKYFNSTIRINKEKRYEVKLLWKDISVELATNYDLALKRLKSTTARLIHLNMLEEYDQQFVEWRDNDIIELVDNDNSKTGHYLPHHAVVREASLTTKIRPVFDASASTNKKGLSLNDCLEKGYNLIELIPPLLIKFRKRSIGVVSDIKKAFLQISLYEEDREFLKFLWWRDVKAKEKELVIYRHKRVVFGVTTSPFLLMATINYHLGKYDSETATIMKNSFYCDNCITSLDSADNLHTFVKEAKDIMLQGCFELRCWVSGPVLIDETVDTTSVLGLTWNPKSDEIFCKTPNFKEITILTKRTLLSLAQSIFDPIGLLSPYTIIPKILIQKCWMMNIDWDESLPTDIEKEVKDWLANIKLIDNCRVPRHICNFNIDSAKNSLHTFCDASQRAYSTCVFLRSEYEGTVSVQLILAKSRVTPSKKCVTMPRLELIAALLAARLATEVKTALDLNELSEFYWTDSSIVLAWIQKKMALNVFVHNRIKEITDRTDVGNWRHIPGKLNPADLPSRGCDIETLINSRWWEGPLWLKSDPNEWPKSEEKPDYNEVNKETTKCMVIQQAEDFTNRLQYFSKYAKIVRMIAWCLRFCRNCRSVKKVKGGISPEEFNYGEKKLFFALQTENFSDIAATSKNMNMEIFKDNDNLFRVKTRLTLTNDLENFIYPILLPSFSKIIHRLIYEKHVKNCHAGSVTLICIIRENYWIVGVRRLAKKVVKECVICQRYNSKRCLTSPAPLPINRTYCGPAFNTVGVDFAGPLFLKDRQKCWVSLFTCATYRAVHLELCKSLSTEEFVLALRRFIARRGRPSIIYSDNATNYRGLYNLLSKSSLNTIKWHFSPPQAPWWGGFWERMVKVIKELLRRTLGRTSLDADTLSTVLCEVEAVANARPLTYIADSSESLTPLTPNMFIQDLNTSDTQNLDEIDSKMLNSRLKYVHRLRTELKERFRSEYLSTLVQQHCKTRNRQNIAPGDVVLIEIEGEKRVNWPLGLILEVFQGADGCVRVARLKTKNGERIRPLQRLFPLECSANSLGM